MKKPINAKRVSKKSALSLGKMKHSQYSRLLAGIKKRVRSAQYQALHAVNKELVALYWDIGRTIVEYALRDARKPIGVAVYRMIKHLPRELKGQLPSPKRIERLLGDIQ